MNAAEMKQRATNYTKGFDKRDETFGAVVLQRLRPILFKHLRHKLLHDIQGETLRSGDSSGEGNHPRL